MLFLEFDARDVILGKRAAQQDLDGSAFTLVSEGQNEAPNESSIRWGYNRRFMER